MAEKTTLSIVIPCYNESHRIQLRFNKAYFYLKQHFSDLELILVNDGSTDDTEDVLNKLRGQYPAIKVISYSSNKGKGYALKKGVEQAQRDIIAFMDADFSISLSEVSKFVDEINNGADLVIGSRRIKGSNVPQKNGILRHFLGEVLAYINSFFLPLGTIRDTQCGFKFFKAKVAKELFKDLEIYRWLFDVDIILMAREKNYLIKQFAVSWEDIKGSKVNIFKDLFPVGRDLIRIYLKFAELKIILIFLFLTVGVILLPFLFNPEQLVKRNGDYSDLVWPNYYFIRDNIYQNNQIPFWNGTLFSGIPEIANPQSPLLYPPNILALVLPIEIAIILLIYLHAVVGGFFMYLLSRKEFKWTLLPSLITALGVMLSPFIWSKASVGHLSQFFAIMLVAPILYYLVKCFKRYKHKTILILLLVFGFQYLNYPTIWFYTVLFLGLGILSFTLYYKKWSWLVSYCVTITISLLFFSPLIFQQLKAGNLITRSILDINDLAIPLWSIKRFISSVLVPSNLLNDLETEVWLYPSLIIVITAIWGWLRLSRFQKVLATIILFLVIGVTLGTRTPFFSFLVNNVPGFSYLRVSTRIWFVMIYVLSLLAGWGLVKVQGKFKLVMACLIFLDLFIFSLLRVWDVPSVMQTSYNLDLINLLQKSEGRYYCTSRCLSARETLPRGIHTADGYHLLLLKDYRIALSNAGGFTPPPYTGNLPSVRDIGAQPSAEELGKFSVKYIISEYPLQEANFRYMQTSGKYQIYENQSYLPRIRFEKSLSNKITIVEDTPNLISITTYGIADKLIVADSYYPDWLAYIDDKQVKVSKEYGWARSILIPEGEHQIQFKFSPFRL